jgi:hypothetical protein
MVALELQSAADGSVVLDADHHLVTLFYESLASLRVEAGALRCATSTTPSRGLLPALGGPWVLEQNSGQWRQQALPLELVSVQFEQLPATSACVSDWQSSSVTVSQDDRGVVDAGVRIAPGIAWLAWHLPTTPTTEVGHAVELRCTVANGCIATPLPGLDSQDAIVGMFLAPSGDVWMNTVNQCLLRARPDTATVAQRLCSGLEPKPIVSSIDGPDVASVPFELFAAMAGSCRHYHDGAIDLLPIHAQSSHAIWLGPGEVLFPSSTATSGPAGPDIWHRGADGSIERETLPLGAVEITAGRTVLGLGPIVGTLDLDESRSLYRRLGPDNWVQYAKTDVIGERLFTFTAFRDGLLYTSQAGHVGQISLGKDCDSKLAIGGVNPSVLVDLELPNSSFIAAGNYPAAYYLVPKD